MNNDPENKIHSERNVKNEGLQKYKIQAKNGCTYEVKAIHLTQTEKEQLKIAIPYCLENNVKECQCNNKRYELDFEEKIGYISMMESDEWGARKRRYHKIQFDQIT